MNKNETCENFWKKRKKYPNYGFRQERLYNDVINIWPYLKNINSFADVGCGDGSFCKIIYNFCKPSFIYACDINNYWIRKLKKQFDKKHSKLEVVNLLKIKNKIPKTDIVFCMGIFIYFFQNKEIINLLKNIDSNKIIIRIPCSLSNNDILINKYSEDLKDNYSAIYRTVDNFSVIIKKTLGIIPIVKRAWPDEIESKYGTNQFLFIIER